MGINFGNIAPAAPADLPASADLGAALTGDADAVTTPQGVTLDLSKASVLNLEKAAPSLKHVKVAAGWNPAVTGEKFDLDVSAYMLDINRKLKNVPDDVVFFNHMDAIGIHLDKDDTSGEGDGDDETIEVDLEAVPAKYDSIVFIVNIYHAIEKKQTFGMVSDSYVRLLNGDENDKEICRFRLKDDYSSSTAIIFARLYRNGSGWDFETIGEGKVVTSLNDIIALYS